MDGRADAATRNRHDGCQIDDTEEEPDDHPHYQGDYDVRALRALENACYEHGFDVLIANYQEECARLRSREWANSSLFWVESSDSEGDDNAHSSDDEPEDEENDEGRRL